MATSTQTQLRRGTLAQINAMTPALGEVVVNTSDKTLHVGDGTTAGGTRLSTKAYADSLLNNTALTGVPTAPTASGGTNSTQVATTAFVTTALAASSGMPAAVTGNLTTGSSLTLTVDFTTYSAYQILVSGCKTVSTPTDLFIDVSKDAFSTTASASGRRSNFSGSTVTSTASAGAPVNNGFTSTIQGILTQPSTTGNAEIVFTVGGAGDHSIVNVTHTLTLAIDSVKLRLGTGTFSTGTVTLQPIAKR